MNDTDFIAAMSQGIPQIPAPSSADQNSSMDQAIQKLIGSLPPLGSLNTLYRVCVKDGEIAAECIPESEWRLPEIDRPDGLMSIDCTGIMKGNADLELSDIERIEGVCAMPREIGYE